MSEAVGSIGTSCSTEAASTALKVWATRRRSGGVSDPAAAVVCAIIDRILARAPADLREIVEVPYLQSGSAGEKAKTLGVSTGHY
jgi:hypothetical protein